MVEVPSTGGAPFTPLEDFTNISGATSGTRSYDISAFISADTMIRFRVNNLCGGTDEFFFVDNVQIEFNGGGGTNQAAVVDAGTDQTITLPNGATLDGTVTDDRLPNPSGAVTTTWSQVSGPGPVTFTDPNAVDTIASFSQAGTFVVRLTVDDSALSAADEVMIEVSNLPEITFFNFYLPLVLGGVRE